MKYRTKPEVVKATPTAFYFSRSGGWLVEYPNGEKLTVSDQEFKEKYEPVKEESK